MRRLTSYGLIAGLSLQDTRRARPGLVMDLYIYRQAYDDAEHGVRRKKAQQGYAD